MTIERHYTPKELAKLMGGSLRKWQRVANEIDGTVRVGRTLHVPGSALDRYLISNRTTPTRALRGNNETMDRLGAGGDKAGPWV